MPVTAKDRVLIVGFEYPLPLRRAVWPWLDRLGLLGPVDLDSPDPRWANVRGMQAGPYIVARNKAVRDIILPRAEKYDWVLMVNNDIAPTESTAKFLDMDADILSCDCSLRAAGAWDSPDAFHLALSCIRMRVFTEMERPWFKFIYSDDGCDLIGCDCNYFAAKARSLGFTTAHGGQCKHDHLGDKFCFPDG